MSRPWELQARADGDWRRVQSYGTEARARAAQAWHDALVHEGRYETRVQARTVEAFAEAYATNAGMPVSRLAESGLKIEPCDCDDVNCLGWRMGAA